MKTRRVVVNERHTFETDLKVQVGDIVQVPVADWLKGTGSDTWEGRVTALTSLHTGACKRILKVVRRAS